MCFTSKIKSLSAGLAVVVGLSFAGGSLATAATYDFDTLTQKSEPRRSVFWVPPADPDLPAEIAEDIVSATRVLHETNYLEAEIRSRALTRDAPERGEGWYLLGMALANQDRFDEALDALDTADTRFDRNGQPAIIRADILMSLKRFEEAEASYLAAFEKDPGLWIGLEQAARLAANRGDLTAALARYQSALSSGARDTAGLSFEIARLALQTDAPETAVETMQSLVSAEPRNLEARAGLGHVLLRTGQPEDAAATFKSLAASAPDEPNATILWARATQSSGAYEEAEKILTEASLRFPDEPQVMADLGRARGALTDYDGAMEAYSTGLKIAPENLEILKGASLVAYRMGDFKTAVAHAEQIITLRPENSGDHAWLGAVHGSAGNKEAAIGAYEKSVALASGNWLALNNLAALLTQGEPERAVELAKDALEASEGHEAVQETLGWAKFAAGDLEGAFAIYDALHAAQPQNAKTALRFGQVQAERGDVEAAKMLLEQAASLDPSLADEAKALLGAL